jgi:hypothetical protein
LIDQVNFFVYICPKYYHMASIPFWETDIKEWNKLTKDSAQLYISQSETLLSGTVDTANNISSTTDKLFGLISTLLTICINYSITGTDINLKAISIAVSLNCFISLIMLLPNLNKYSICLPGEEPKNIFTSNFIDNDYTFEEQYQNLVFQIIQTIQSRITQNHKINNRRQDTIQRVRYALVMLPVTIAISILWSHNH